MMNGRASRFIIGALISQLKSPEEPAVVEQPMAATAAVPMVPIAEAVSMVVMPMEVAVAIKL